MGTYWSFEAGFHADLIIKDRNSFTCEVGEMADVKILRTIVGRRIVWKNGTTAVKK